MHFWLIVGEISMGRRRSSIIPYPLATPLVCAMRFDVCVVRVRIESANYPKTEFRRAEQNCDLNENVVPFNGWKPHLINYPLDYLYTNKLKPPGSTIDPRAFFFFWKYIKVRRVKNKAEYYHCYRTDLLTISVTAPIGNVLKNI